MSGERRAIESPLLVDFTGWAVPPLKFMLQAEHSPAGIVERSEGIVVASTPWYREFALEMTGSDGFALAYLMPMDDDTDLLMACLHTTAEPYFRAASGADFGDAVTRLTALHWPDIYGFLLASNRRTPRARILCNVATPGQVQWVVADQIPVAQVEHLSAGQFLEFVFDAVEIFLRTSQFYSELPGVIDVLGGPDRTSRRLKAAAGLFGAAGGMTDSLKDGIAIDEVIEVAKSARESLEALIALKD